MAIQNSRQDTQHPKGFQMPAEPANISSSNPIGKPKQMKHPMIPMSPAMMTSIKNSPKGKIPAGLARYLASKKKGGK